MGDHAFADVGDFLVLAPERVERGGIDFVAAAVVAARFEDRTPDRVGISQP